ncbi:FGGY-family carbohydrate kinase [Thiomicrospira sp. R3]|uniref:FGGY-family carbohydrate kinase n=1 Tax=Thiomicrospira sp. R3 TaxID=3035472 RepID=UPI00259B88FD|nr:FGGY-family carbohydrate kinase [Thiomicrospira sp. R3]WFE68560.1 FGGY-family carbohydrate kinase [Thiomicrospira sp. R3]
MIQHFTALGIDLGTSGLRLSLVKKRLSTPDSTADEILTEISSNFPMPVKQGLRSEQSVEHWQQALEQCFKQLAQTGLATKIDGIIADATSSSILLMDARGQAISPALMYDDKRAQIQAEKLCPILAHHSAAHGASSSLAKAIWLAENYKGSDGRLVHQIDWLNYQLCGHFCATDENNLLKLGYDSINQAWPNAIQQCLPFPLPTVVAAGTLIGQVSQQLQTRWGFRPDCKVFAGTTDSIAAFLASGASEIGDGVSALGSTLAIKLLSPTPLFAPEYGIYSHKLKNQWLVGGASNTGGAVLLHYFSLDEIKARVPQINIHRPTGLKCYPLIRPGERFPIADPNHPPIIPTGLDDIKLLQALIEGLVEVEVCAYDKLAELGAPRIKRLFGVGGGSQNQAWSDLRAQRLPAKLVTPFSQSAAYGVTRLINLETLNDNSTIN